MRPIVYVAGPFRGKTPWDIEQNIRRAETVGLELARIANVTPMIPHTMYRYFQDALPDMFWLRAGLDLLKRCDAIFLCKGWERSQGSVREKEKAESLSIAVFRCGVHPRDMASEYELVKDWADIWSANRARGIR